MNERLATIALHKLPIAVVDFETTGLNAAKDRVVQMGVVHFEGTTQARVELSSLINPQCPIDRRASAIHGITDKDVAQAPTFADRTGRLVSLLEGRVFAAYNAAFDLRFLRAELRRAGLDFETPFICVMQIGQMIFPGRRGRLVDACREMGVRRAKEHDATADAYAAALLLQRYFSELRQLDIRTIDHLREYGQRAFVSSFSCPGFSTAASPVVASHKHTTDAGTSELERTCERLNQQTSGTITLLESLLVSGVKTDVRVRWNRLMMSPEFPEPMPAIPALDAPTKPDLLLKPDPSKKPSPDDSKYQIDEGLMYSLVPWLKEKKVKELEEEYQDDLDAYGKRVSRWNRLVAEYRERAEQAKQAHATQMQQYREAERQYLARRQAFLEQVAVHNAKINLERTAYEQGEQVGVVRAMTRVLMNSEAPSDFPDTVDVEFDQVKSLLRVTRGLPIVDDMPAVKGYRVVKKDAELKEQPMSDAARKRLYDGVVYQMALRTVHEIFSGDTAKHIRAIEVMCTVDGYDPATGHPARLVLARLCAERFHVAVLMLENVDPEVCFKSLGGTTNGRPANLKAIELLPELRS